MPLYGGSGSIGGSSPILAGTYTVATLPPAAANQAKYAFVTDLGGGADMVLSDGANWKHIRRGLAGVIAPAAAIPITPLMTPTIILLAGAMSTSVTLTLQTQNLYPGFELTIVRPSALGTLMTIGIAVQGMSGVKNILGSSWTDYQWDGSALQTLRNSSLL